MPGYQLPSGVKAITKYLDPKDPASRQALSDSVLNPKEDEHGFTAPAGQKTFGYYNAPVSSTKKDSKTTSSGGGSSSASGGSSSGSSGGSSKSDMAVKPELNLPELRMSDGASVLNQFNNLRSKDSMLKQKAIADAHAYGVAGGKIHSAQQAGVTERAIEDRLMPLAQAEASLVATTDINNWTNKVGEYMTVYEAEFSDYLKDKGYAHETQIAKLQAETALTQTLMNNIGDLLNNTDLDVGPEVYSKLVDPYNSFLTQGWFNYA